MTRQFTIYFTLFFLLLSVALKAQEYRQHEIGTPFIRNYPPREYKAFSQNWAIVQDTRGVMYFANGDGVLEYDGVNWRLIRIKNNYMVSCLSIDDNGVIWVGSINELGYLAPDHRGLMHYVSLSHLIEESKMDFGYIYNIYNTGNNEFILVTNKSVCKLTYIDNIFEVKVYPDILSVFNVSEKFYGINEASGLCLLLKDTVLSVKNGEFFKDKGIQKILDYNDTKVLISTRDEGMFLVSKIESSNYNKAIEIEAFPTQIDEFLKKNRFQTARKLKEDGFAFATTRGGTIIMDMEGNLIQILNKNIGIYNDTHYYIFQDSEEAIWLALDNGISKAEINSPISFWNDATGLKGSVLSVIRFENTLYAATWQGVFYLDVSGFNNKYEGSNIDILVFKPVKGIYSTCWDFLELKFDKRPNILLAATTDGIFQIQNDTSVVIYKGNTNKLHRSRNKPHIILAGLESGAMYIEMDTTGKETKLKKPVYIPKIEQRVISIGETTNGRLWLGTQYDGLILLKENNISDTILFKPEFFTQYKSKNIDGSVYINEYLGHLLFASENGLFYFTNAGTFKPYSVFLNHIISNRGVITVFKQDFKGNLWLQGTLRANGEKLIICVERKKTSSKIFSVYPFKPIPKAEIWNIYPEKNGITWLCSDEGLFRYNSNISYFYQKDFKTLIRKVVLENDSLYFGGYHMDFEHPFSLKSIENDKEETTDKKSINYNYNSVIFEFASLFFYDELQNQYKHYLDGFDKKWSDWSTENKKEYTNLPHGKYIFKVYSKNIFENEGQLAEFEFEILPPWYRTYFAYFIFLLILGCFIYLLVKYSNKRLQEAKLRLENMVQERTQEIVKQKKELEIEKEKSDRLLLNILPYKIAEELKEKGYAKAKYYKHVSVMFADFTGFTQIAEKMEPEELIKELNKCFVYFDEVCVRHNLEKIKTVGDSYMCAGGVPIQNATNPIDIVLASLEMINFIKNLHEEQEKKGLVKWHIRIGIHTGEIIAGVVGKKKFAYDIWGDTVNTASRLESTSEPDKVNISGATYKYIKDYFVCEYRGKVAAKHKGEVDMNFVYRIKPELSHDEAGYIPNIRFKEMYNQLLNE